MFYYPLKKDNSTIAIVDGYSVGGYFAKTLKDLGYKCVHIQSTKNIPEMYSTTFDSKNYKHNLIFNGTNLQSIIDILKNYNTQNIIAGTEPGVELTDTLSEKLELISNGTRRSKARRNKFEMIEALKEHNLKTVKHVKSDNLEKIFAFADELHDWPIVIKQLKSAGAEKIFFCNSKQEISDAFYKIIGTKDIFGSINTEVLAESYLDGITYVVNMVSVNGRHILSDLWDVGKKALPNTNVVYDFQRLLPCSFYLKDPLISYTRKVLDALEIKHGASHNEIFWTKDGPILVESAARIMGAMNPQIIAQCVKRSQLELTLASYLQPELFMEKDLCDYELKKHLMFKFLISYKSGVVKKIKFLDEIKSLPSFKEISLNTEVGKPISRTIDLFTMPGIVCLCHDDEKVVQKDYETISYLEQEMFVV